MRRWRIIPETSHVWIEGSSTLHPVRSVAAGLCGWMMLATDAAGPVPGSDVSGHVEIAVDRLASGNTMVDRETRRRIDARRFPVIAGDIERGRVASDGTLAIQGTISFRGERIVVDGELDVRLVDTDRVVLVGAAIFDVRWWDLEPPKLGPLRVNPDIEVTIEVTLEPEEASTDD